MRKSSVDILDAFGRKVQALDQMRKKQEGFYSKDRIARRDIEEVYAAIFLNAVVSFEGLIEDLFIGLLPGKVASRRSNVSVRVRVNSERIARELVLQGKKFFNWLPYENTKNMAKVFFAAGRPFTLLTRDEEKHIEKCLTIRHAIAHQSRYAISKFRQEVLPGLYLNPRDSKPKAFLRVQFSATPATIYYEQLVGELYRIAEKLC